MSNLIKLKVILLVFSIFLISVSVAADRILPIPKPTVDQEIKSKVERKKHIYPQKKPDLKKKKTEIKTVEETAESFEETGEEIFIYPKKRPLTVKKIADKAVTKSAILSKNDFKIAKSAFAAIDKKKWKTAKKLSKKTRNKTLYNLINYLI